LNLVTLARLVLLRAYGEVIRAQGGLIDDLFAHLLQEIESFNGRLRDECLNEHWFMSLPAARVIVEAWRDDYNGVRPHSALGNLTPEEFAEQMARKTPAGL
jgi:hypothetical protein